MDYQNKSEEELIRELQKLQQEHNSLKTSYEKDITDIKQEMRKLQRSEMQFRSLVDNSPDLIVLLDRQLRFLYVNPAAAKAGHYSSFEYCGKTIGEAGVSEEASAEWKEYIRTAFETGQVVEAEGNFETLKGLRNFHVKFVPEFASDGSVYSVQAIARDIKERKLMERALRESEERFRTVVETAHDIIWIVNTQGEFTYVNIQAEKISGYKISDWIGKSFIPLIHPEDLPKIQKIFLETLRGKPHSYEVRIFGSNHEIIILSVNTVPIYKDNFVTGTSSYGRDITRQRQAEETLKINEALFHELYDNMKSGSAIFRVINDGSKGSDYIIKKINRTGLKMEGKTLEEVVDKKLIDIRPTIDSFGLIPVMKKVWETGKSAFLPAGIYTDERYSNYYENYVFKLTTGEVVTLYDDVTERKRAGENIKEMKESLEKLNQRLNEIRENERAMISREIHDQLGQSMTALKIDLNWLCGKIAGESEEGAKLNEMIELVTATSRDIQRISSELRPAILDDLGLPAALEWYCEEFAKRTRLQIQMEIDDVQAENINKNLAIYRVLQESLTNIIRHAGAKRVLVKLCKIKKDIVLLIQDDGIGIPADKIRSSKSLGLLGMFERVKQYNGYMEITTPAKRGTSVRISISEK